MYQKLFSASHVTYFSNMNWIKTPRASKIGKSTSFLDLKIQSLSDNERILILKWSKKS